MEPPAKRVKSEGEAGSGGAGGGGGGQPGSDGGGAGRSADGSPADGRARLIAGTARPLRSDLIAVGRLASLPEYVQTSAGGISMNVDVETRLTDIYAFPSWWLELPNVEDVESDQRRRILVEAIPLGDPSTATLTSMQLGNAETGRAVYHRYRLLLFRDAEDFFSMVAG